MLITDKLYSVFTNKCPKCHTGKVFIYDNPFLPKKWDKMHVNCSACNELYEREPGFFYGAMYVSYALTSGWFLVTFLPTLWLFNLSTMEYFIPFSLSLIILIPVTYRWSRLLWLNFFVKFDKKKVAAAKETLMRKSKTESTIEEPVSLN